MQSDVDESTHSLQEEILRMSPEELKQFTVTCDEKGNQCSWGTPHYDGPFAFDVFNTVFSLCHTDVVEKGTIQIKHWERFSVVHEVLRARHRKCAGPIIGMGDLGLAHPNFFGARSWMQAHDYLQKRIKKAVMDKDRAQLIMDLLATIEEYKSLSAYFAIVHLKDHFEEN